MQFDFHLAKSTISAFFDTSSIMNISDLKKTLYFFNVSKVFSIIDPSKMRSKLSSLCFFSHIREMIRPLKLQITFFCKISLFAKFKSLDNCP